MQRIMLGLPQGHTSPAAALAKRKEVGEARKASDKKRARSAQRKPPSTPSIPSGAFSGRAKRFSELPGLRGMGTPGSTRASVLQSPELLNASAVSITSAGQGAALNMSMDDLFSPGPATSKLGSKSPQLVAPASMRMRRGWQAASKHDDVFDATTLDKLLGAPSSGRGYGATDSSAVRMPVGVAGTAQIRQDLGVSTDDLGAMQASLKQWVAEHIATVFLPTFEANAVALHAAYENVPGVSLGKDFLLRTGEVAMRTEQGEVLTLGKLIAWYTDPKNAQHCRTRELRLSATEAAPSSGTLEEWNSEYDDRHGANSLPESAARFWMSCSARRLLRSRETSQRGGDPSVVASTAKLTVSLWHERAQLESFFDLLGRYAGSDRYEYMKNYALRRLAAMGHSGMTAFQGDEGGVQGGSRTAAAAAAQRERSAGMPSDAFIVLCYFISVLDAAMANTYPGEVGQLANGGMGVLSNGGKGGSRGRFSARHVVEGSSVSEGISEGDRPVLHIVSGAGGGELHCRLLLNDIAYDSVLEAGGGHARSAAFKEKEEGQSLWRTLALLLHCIDKRSGAREHFRSFQGVLDSVAKPALQARAEVSQGHLTYDQFFLD